MADSTVSVDRDDDGILVLTINRPDKLNALNRDVMESLRAFFSAPSDDVAGVIVTGAGGKAFVAGADISQFTDLSPHDAQRFASQGQDVFNLIETYNRPVIAAVNGWALGGGCELAMACHMRLASDNARFGQPEVNLGIIPGYGGTQRLPRLVGRGIATEMILTGNPVDAQTAKNIGLVNKVVAADELLDAAREIIRSIASKAPVAVELCLKALHAATAPLASALDLEAALFAQAAATDDFREGAAAFAEKRKPQFRGK